MRLQVHDWRALLRLSDEQLILYAQAAGARRYQLYRNTHDAAEALLLVEAANAEALRSLCTALLHGTAAAGLRPARPEKNHFWEPVGARSIGAAQTHDDAGLV
jgi:hypothetical protein